MEGGRSSISCSSSTPTQRISLRVGSAPGSTSGSLPRVASPSPSSSILATTSIVWRPSLRNSLTSRTPEKPAVRPVSSASSRPAHSGIVSPGSSLPPGSTQYESLSGFWWRTRSRVPSRSTTAATRTPKSISRASRSLPMRRVYPRGDQGELRDVRRLLFLALRPAEVRDLGLHLVAGLEHQTQTFVFGEMPIVGFEDTRLGGWVVAGRTAVVKEHG